MRICFIIFHRKSNELEECELFQEMFKTPVERQMFILMASAVKLDI